MSKFKVLVTNPTIPSCWLELLKEKCDVKLVEDPSRETVLKNIPGVDAIYWSSAFDFNKELLDAAGPKLKIIATMASGYNEFDLDELKKRCITLCNTPDVLKDTASNIAIMLALAAARRMQESRVSIEKGEWSPHFDPNYMLGMDIQDSTVGFIGMGRIGKTIVKKLQCFDVKTILYADGGEKEELKKYGAKFVDKDTVARESDFIFVTCILKKETKGLCDACFFSKMKRTAIFVNTSRGAIVVQDDLIQALKEKRIFAAGIDVTDPEPLPPDSELFKLPNAVITPHLGSSTTRTRKAMADVTCNNILRALNGEEVTNRVV